jgi:Holliday junction resolvase-like predicted endonuclease
MLGITQEELERYFSGYIEILAREEGMNYEEVLEKIRFWYNGFCFDGARPKEDRRVYNPFSTLLLFENKIFSNYWFESGTPKFLIDLIIKKEYDITELEDLESEVSIFESYEPDSLDVVALLFQTGYITLKERISEEVYRLTYPNYEVKKSFLRHILRYMSDNRDDMSYIRMMNSSLKEGNIDRFMELMKSLFAGISYDITDRVSDREQHYQSLMYLVLALLGVDVRGEVRTNRGRIDLVVEVGDVVWIIEAKIRGSSREALRQIEDRGYIERYVGREKKVKKIGIVFDVDERNVKEWEVEEV